MIEEVEAPFEIDQVNSLHSRVREGLDQQAQRWDRAVKRRQAVRAETQHTDQQLKVLRIQIDELERQLPAVEEDLSMLQHAQSDLTEKNTYLTDRERQQADTGNKKRKEYVRGLEDQINEMAASYVSVNEAAYFGVPQRLPGLVSIIRQVESSVGCIKQALGGTDGLGGEGADERDKRIISLCGFNEQMVACLQDVLGSRWDDKLLPLFARVPSSGLACSPKRRRASIEHSSGACPSPEVEAFPEVAKL